MKIILSIIIHALADALITYIFGLNKKRPLYSYFRGV